MKYRCFQSCNTSFWRYFFLLALIQLPLFSVDLQCSSQKGTATLNEVYSVGNSDLVEIKVFDPYNTNRSGWSIKYCANNTDFSQCTSLTNVSAMTQGNDYWFYKQGDLGLPGLNKSDKFTLLLVDSGNNIIDMLGVNNASFKDTLTCSFIYDTDVVTNSDSKAVARFPDGTGDWDDSQGQGRPTEQTPGGSNDTNLKANYRFDACSWNGTASEVIDSSGNNYHGTSVMSDTSSYGKIYRSGDFTADGTKDYAVLDHRALDGLDDFSMSVWMKTPYDKAMIPISGARSGIGSNEAIMWFTSGNKFKPYIKQTQADTINLTTNVADGNWHHFVWTRSGIRNCAYVDGTAPICVDVPGSSGALTIAPGGLIVGQEQDGVGTGFNANQDYEGLLDEVKIYSSSLSLTQVKSIYDNESAGKNYDGTIRNPVTCSNQIIADYRMDECFWDGTPGEVKDSTATPYNGTSKGDANTSVNAGGGLCYNGNFVSNYVELSAFPDITGSRTITAWFNTKETSSTIHQRIFADDESNSNGSYALSVNDPGSGRVRFYIRGLSTVSLDSTNVVAKDTWYFAAATFNATTMKKTLYIYDASGSLLNEVSQTVSGTVGTPSGKASLGGEVAGGEVANRFNGYLDEVKVFTRALDRIDLETILNNEKAGLNWDGTGRICPPCQVVIPKNGNYNAVDRVVTGCSVATHWNNILSTRIVNDDISLSVLAKDKVTNLPLEADITKIRLMHYPSGNNNACSGASLASVDVCTNCGTTDANGCLNVSVDKSLNQRASKCVEILIEGKDKTDTTGATASESNASDNFAVRPNTFDCDSIAPSTLVAEKTYGSTFKATPLNLTTPTQSYTTSSVVLSANKYMRTGELNITLSGAMSPSILNFMDGSASANISFNDACDVGIDLNDSTWADVDSDDTPEANRVIHAECRRLFRPDHFLVELTRPLLENNTTSFTYLANLAGDVNMSAWVRNLNATITAKGEANRTMQNYSYPTNRLYANNIELFPALSLPLKHSSAIKRVDLNDANSSDISGFSFSNGVATLSYSDVAFNYYRDYKTPIAPFVVNGSESEFSLKVQDSLYSSVLGDTNTDADANVTFYYGRLRTTGPLATSYLPITYALYIDIYDGSNWLVNTLHNGNSAGFVFDSIASSNTSIDNGLPGFSITHNTVLSGKQDLTITAASANYAQIHLKTQEWLWYLGPYALAYEHNAGSDCEMHPCFDFSMLLNNSALKIQSGDFNGTVIPDVNRSDYFKKGTKLFR